MNQALSSELSRVMQEMAERDAKDELTGKELQGEMLENGFSVYEAKNCLEIDTGTNGGIDNTIATIIVAIAKTPDCRLITIEGLSGTGKSTASSVLAERINGSCLSTGEIFRYLALQKILSPNLSAKSILKKIRIEAMANKAQLWKGNTNLSERYAEEFRRGDVEKMACIFGATSQLPVINFLFKEVIRLRKNDQANQKMLILEGRSYNMRYFPADLRVILKSDLLTRAQKRLNQWR